VLIFCVAVVAATCAPLADAPRELPPSSAAAAVATQAGAAAPIASVAPPALPSVSPSPAPLPFAVPTGLPLAALPPVRFARPDPVAGARRIGIQAGHWLTEQVPADLRGLESATGASWGALTERDVNVRVANAVAAALRARGHVVDVLATAVPPGYLADAFVAIHADGEPSGRTRGFKIAHSAYPRSPHDVALARALAHDYGAATGLPIDPALTGRMYRYYAFAWSRYSSAVSPHTPAAIIEMGFVTNAADREVLLERTDQVVAGIVAGISRFLEAVPRQEVYPDDLVLTPWPPFTGRTTVP